MRIIQNLPNVMFSQNAPNLIIGGNPGEAIQVSATLLGATLFSDMTFYPDSNYQITIYTKQLTRNLMAYSGPSSPWAKGLPILYISIVAGDQKEKINSAVVPGGIDSKINDIPEWMARNFLTWQSQTIETTFDQPQRLYLVGAKETNAIIYSKLYTQDGQSFIKKVGNGPSSSAVFLYCYNVGYKDLWEEFCENKRLSPLCYDVYGADGDGSNVISHIPHAQRYILRKQRYYEVCFGFINTLGGFDTLMMRGSIVLKPEGENETFINNEIEKELSNGYTSYWEASTGYIDSELAAAQYQDFLKSTDRWIYRAGEWLRIIVDEYKVEHTPRELNAYTFKYHLAEKNERRFFDRERLPEPTLPNKFFQE